MPIEYCFRSFFLIIWFKSVLSLSPRRLVPWQLTCAVWCLVGFEGSNLPYRKQSQLPVIWPKSFRFGLLEEMRALWYDVCVSCNLFGIVFQQTLYIQFGRIAIWYLLGTCWKQMVFPAIRSILSVSMRELGMNHQNCNFCGNKLGPDSSINFFLKKPG